MLGIPCSGIFRRHSVTEILNIGILSVSYISFVIVLLLFCFQSPHVHMPGYTQSMVAAMSPFSIAPAPHITQNQQTGYFECRGCNFKSKWKISVQRHIRVKHLHYLHCKKCSITFDSGQKLSEHLYLKHSQSIGN